MTRFVVDAGVALRLAEGDGAVAIPQEHELLAPTLLRSHVLSMLHERSMRGEIEPALAFERLGQVQKLPIRLLGDLVLRRKAWEVADRLGWTSTYDAEYVALVLLQGDALVTLEGRLAREAAGLVAVAPFEALTS